MKLIIAGSRDIAVDLDYITDLIELNHLSPTEVVCGGAKGIDKCGERWAALNNVAIKHFPADWKTHGFAAGPIRNGQMADYADALLLIWNGFSRGSANMKKTMAHLGKPIIEVICENRSEDAVRKSRLRNESPNIGPRF